MAKNQEVKINIVYNDLEGKTQIESVWAEKDNNTYKIVNIPFFAYNIAYGDIVSVDEDDGELYFDELINPSGHSTIQMIIANQKDVKEIGDQLIALGCDWEGSHIGRYISIDIPVNVSYKQVRDFLESGRYSGKWDYKEACLAHKI